MAVTAVGANPRSPPSPAAVEVIEVGRLLDSSSSHDRARGAVSAMDGDLSSFPVLFGMQSRHRSSGNRIRGYSSSYRSFGRGGFNRGSSISYAPPPAAPPSPPPPPRRPKADIFLEAGRLAAEYLVFKGLLSPELLPRKLPESEPALKEGRISALARLGSSVSIAGNGRKRFNDDYSSMISRRGRRRSPYDHRGYGSESHREGPWNGRCRGYSDSKERDFAPSYHQDRRSSFDDVASSSTPMAVAAADELHRESEVTGESGTENCKAVDDPGSMAISSATKEEVPLENNESGFSNSETVEEDAKSGVGDDSREEDESLSMLGDNLSELCGFPKVPTKPRSTSAQRSLRFDTCRTSERTTDLQVSPGEAGTLLSEDVVIKGPSTGPEAAVVVGEETNFEQQFEGREEDAKRELNLAPGTSVDCGLSSINSPRTSSEDEMINLVEEVKPKGVSQCTKAEDGSAVEPGEEAQKFMPDSFKIRDLDLMETPGLTTVAVEPAMENPVSSPAVEIEKEGHNVDAHGQIPNEDAVVQVIDLDDDSPIREVYCDTMKSKSEMTYSGMENFPNHTDQAYDLSAIQDGYSFAFTELLGSDIRDCSPVHGDPSNLHASMGLHRSEGHSLDDDSIYVTLGEFPIGLMEVWDQPAQDFGKFF